MNEVEKAREEIAEYLAKWFDKGRDFGRKNIDKGTLANLENDAGQILSIKIGNITLKELIELYDNKRLVKLCEIQDTDVCVTGRASFKRVEPL